ncbi:MAG TPA: LysM domain-containing protein [Pseudidiomarina sp.]|nr:LysM domain-containing protein [Pseudidiomarina sp.]
MASWRLSTIAVIGFLLLTSAGAATRSYAQSNSSGDILRLKEDAPAEYVVKKGDTLWDIAGFYLDDPWLWTELWRVNDTVDNPHLIYPGDKLYLSWVDGRPTLSRKVTKTILPEGVIEPKGNALRMFPSELIEPFITAHSVFSEARYKEASHVLGDNRAAPRINGMAPVFVTGRLADANYQILTPVKRLDDAVLLRHISDARVLMQQGDMTEMEIIRPQREIRRGDRVVEVSEFNMPELLVPASGQTTGSIVASLNERQQQGKWDIVVLNFGEQDGVEPGQMYRAIRPGTEIFMDGETPEAVSRTKASDLLSRYWRATMQLPEHTTSELMVISTQETTSFAIVLRSNEWLSIGADVLPMQL